MVLPPGPLGSCIRGPPSIASEGGRERSYSGKLWSCSCAPARPAGVRQAEEAPRRCKGPPWALTPPPTIGECAGRGPTRFRAAAEAVRPVVGTYK